MEIKLITEDFKDSIYLGIVDCPLARALKRLFPDRSFLVGGFYVSEFEPGEKPNITTRLGNFIIPRDWNSELVGTMINKADRSEEVSYVLNLEV